MSRSEVDGDSADLDAMRRLRNGEDLALNELMERWQLPLTRYLLRYTGNEAEAHDLAQETFVRLYESRHRFEGKGRFSTWLYTIATNLSRNLARTKRRHPTCSLESMGGEAPIKPDAGTPVSAALNNELAQAIQNALQELPRDQQTATVLFEYEGLPQAEIAGILGCSIKAVENKLYRARQFLRQRLERWLQAKT